MIITAETARKELYRATLLKIDDLPQMVKDIFLEELDEKEEYYIPFEIETMVSTMLNEANIKYEHLMMPPEFTESLENIMIDFNYSVEGVYSFPELAKYKDHSLFKEVMRNIELVYYPNGGGSGNLIEFIHLSSSTFATSSREYERDFALQDPTAFLLAVQDNGLVNSEAVLQFLLKLKHSIDYISQLTMN